MALCEEFHNINRLRALFISERLQPFQAGLTYGYSVAEQVDLVIAYLAPKYLSDGQNALVILIDELRDHVDQSVELHDKLAKLASRLKETV